MQVVTRNYEFHYHGLSSRHVYDSQLSADRQLSPNGQFSPNGQLSAVLAPMVSS